jgi:hypothetical protein
MQAERVPHFSDTDRDTVRRWLPYVLAAELAEASRTRAVDFWKLSTRRRPLRPNRKTASPLAIRVHCRVLHTPAVGGVDRVVIQASQCLNRSRASRPSGPWAPEANTTSWRLKSSLSAPFFRSSAQTYFRNRLRRRVRPDFCQSNSLENSNWTVPIWFSYAIFCVGSR